MAKNMRTCRKPCYGKCERCVWKNNGGCSEWEKGANHDTGATAAQVAGKERRNPEARER